MSASVLVALRVKASPERAFQVFTQDIAHWWRHDVFFAFTPRAPGRLAFEPGEGGRLVEHWGEGRVFEIGQIKVWAPPHQLSFTWRQATFTQDMSTLVEVQFEPVGAETRISVRHSGWETVPDGHVARHGHVGPALLKRLGEAWRAHLQDLQDAIAR